MKFPQPATIKIFATVVMALTFAPHLEAAVTNVVWYRLGENDPGARSGNAVTNTTADLIGFENLKQSGSPIYTTGVSAEALNRVRSSFAVSFNGTSQYVSNAVVSAAVDNFGLEAWVKPNATAAGNRTIVCNGSPVASGWAFIQHGGTEYNANLGGVTTFGSGTAAAGTWTHLALVRDNGTATFYVNGVASGTSASVPVAATNAFMIGAHPQLLANTFFNGVVDEVRVFTFGPGRFSTNDLLLHVQRAVTLPASSIGPASATLNAAIHPAGLPTSSWFEWGITTNYGNATASQNFTGGLGRTNVSQTLGGLVAGATYHFRCIISNALGAATGSNQTFTAAVFALDNTVSLPAAAFGSVAWVDFNDDGRLDILLTGTTNGAGVGAISQLWRNTGSGFALVNTNFPAVDHSSITLGELDNDGSPDFTLAGQYYNPPGPQNPNGATNWVIQLPPWSFFQTGAEARSVLASGDIDNDGRVDVFYAGPFFNCRYVFECAPAQGIARVLGATVYDAFDGLELWYPPYVQRASLAFADFNKDGWLDFFVSGTTNTGSSPTAGGVAQILRNSYTKVYGNVFTNIDAGLPGVFDGSVAWGDFDNDGRPDLLLTGTTNGSGAGALSQVWRNTGNSFSNINAGLPGVFHSSVAWGDYDNDGRLDILLTGTTNGNASGGISQIWRNNGNGFENINAALPAISFSSVAWGDYDNDGRLDILLEGSTTANAPLTQLWRNLTPLTNTPPVPPSNLAVSKAGDIVTFSWNAATDAQTPGSGLSYNIRVGTSSGGNQLVSATSRSSGWRRLPQTGNAQQNQFWFATTLPTNVPIYWSVQAIDTTFAGSSFAPEATFKLIQTAPVIAPATATNIVAGDLNGDGILGESEFAALLPTLNGNGIVTESELRLVLSNYFPNNPFLQMTNAAGLGGTNVTFALSNSLAVAFSVEYTTNLTDWYFLGTASPRYLFTDTNAPAAPQRSYRLRWP